jgi:uncharacterized protein YecT (DUF1311 family)
MKTNKIIFFIFFLMFCSNVQLSAQTQLEMNDDAYKSYKKADAELNIVYQKLMKKLDKNEKAMLTTAQKNWLKYRDSHCDFEAEENEGGSIKPMVWAACLEEVTIARIKDLKQSFKSRFGTH